MYVIGNTSYKTKFLSKNIVFIFRLFKILYKLMKLIKKNEILILLPNSVHKNVI